jgi:histone-lysine N-methyltransferase SETMAR
MTKVRDFVAGLARSNKSAAEIKTTVNTAFGDKALGLMLKYYILKKVKGRKSTNDQRHLNAKKTKRKADIVTAVAADVAEDGQFSCKDLASAHGLSIETVFNILRDDLGLMKKSARWVPKLLSDEQNQECVQTCQEFIRRPALLSVNVGRHGHDG